LQEPEQVLALYGDAPFRWRKGQARDMKEDRASPPSRSRHKIIVEHDDHIVKVIIAPEYFGARCIRQGDFAIVIPVIWRVTPADAGA
jgi:hypothetical protein